MSLQYPVQHGASRNEAVLKPSADSLPDYRIASALLAGASKTSRHALVLTAGSSATLVT